LTAPQEELVRIHDEPLYRHLKSVGIDFLIFAMRWVITLLVREMPIKSLIRYAIAVCRACMHVTRRRHKNWLTYSV
jgi:hypothetical protein